MNSDLPVGHPRSLGETPTATPSPTTLTPEQLEDPELVALVLAAADLERKKLKWASWADTQYVKCRNARTPFERQWYINLAFTAGKQYVVPIDVPTAGFRLVTPKSPPWRVNMVVNKIRTAVKKECSKLTTSKPIPTVMPSTNEDEDFSASAVGEQILKSKFATADFESRYRLWIWWGVVCGTSFLKQYWDPHAKDYESKTLPPLPAFPAEAGEFAGRPLPAELIQKVDGLVEYLNTPIPAVGKICIENVSPFHIYVPDLLSESMEDQPYVIHVMTKSPLWVQSRYGFKPSCDTRASSTVLDAARIIAKGSEEHLDSVLVKEVWIKPGGHEDFPEGGVLTIINTKAVQVKDKWPYPFPEYPFYKFNSIPTGGFYADSNVVDLIPLQKEYNKKRSQALEIQNTMGKPKFVYQQGSMNPRKISSEPGQSVPYIAGYQPPVIIPGAEVPMSFVNEIEKLQQEFDDISGQHEISRGGTPNNAISSGTAIAYLQEQDDATLNYPVCAIENATEKMGAHYLEFASTYWDDERLVKVTGKNDSFEALHWKKGMLKGNTDVKVQTGSALPFSKAAKQALLTEWMQMGVIAPEIALEMMSVGGLDKALEEALIDKRQAVRENMKMADMGEEELTDLEPYAGPNGEPPFELPDPSDPDGTLGMPPIKFNGDQTPFQPQPPIPVNSWDNHEEHIRWHNHYRKTQSFELLPESNKMAFELHVQLHQAMLTSSMLGFSGQPIGGPEPELDAEGNEVPPEEASAAVPPTQGEPPQ